MFGASGGSKATIKEVNDVGALLTDDLKAEIVNVFVEGDFEFHELRDFLTAEPPDTVARLWPELIRHKRQANSPASQP